MCFGLTGHTDPQRAVDPSESSGQERSQPNRRGVVGHPPEDDPSTSSVWKCNLSAGRRVLPLANSRAPLWPDTTSADTH